MRLQKYMAGCGVASRRECENLIAEGRVCVNEVVVRTQGVVVDPQSDVVTVDGRIIQVEEEKVYVAFFKPRNVITSVKDQFGRTCVNDFFKEIPNRIYPVGRLDYETEGLLIMTNDGDFMYAMTHPKHNVDKTYVAKVEGVPDAAAVARMGESIVIDGRATSPAIVKRLGDSEFEITIHDGRNRQVRRLCEYAGHPVLQLKRVSIGNLKLDLEAPGQWRYLGKEEIDKI